LDLFTSLLRESDDNLKVRNPSTCLKLEFVPPSLPLPIAFTLFQLPLDLMRDPENL
jgi:hypothetical protein